ncbi:DoxX family protein [Kitasatospora brasiliensis]|uniref:DoxX family protein n=1 Tax=Kitasatospora brasiliensis TaxID=3058040 RepID=UPI002930ED7B|nr:DoxX family protein [Kitasatospora sp. K002]
MESYLAQAVRSGRRRADAFSRGYRRVAPAVLRVSVGAVYLWFGVLKFIPGASPAEDLATRCMSLMTFDLVPPGVSRPLLALMEVAIGAGLVTGLLLRLTLAVFFTHMAGVFATLVLLPNDVWVDGVPPVPTLEGQYILKNVVLIAACLTVATRGAERAEPAAAPRAVAKPLPARPSTSRSAT